MSEDEEPKKKRKGKGLSKKKMAAIVLILLIFFAGMAFQHYSVEPLLDQTTAKQYAECLSQKQVLDQRFIECSNGQRACEYQLEQCLGT